MIIPFMRSNAWPRGHRLLVIAAGHAAFLVTSLPAAGAAQQPPDPDPEVVLKSGIQSQTDWAAKWLASSDPRRVAWGASLARVDRRDLVPQLTAKVQEYDSLGDSGAYAVLHSGGRNA
jgi:hypothetical protein